jgi:hypothetical protein
MNTRTNADKHTMRITRAFMAAVALTLCALPSVASASIQVGDDATRRVALIIGHHEGGPGRERLLYAGSDAYNFRRTLEELGGLREGDATLLVDPDSARLLRALDDMEERTRALKRAGQRVEAIVYYSGHADEKGFRLGNQGVDYLLFRSRLNALGADVRIAVVDACESGALTRLKGGRPAPAFLVDRSVRSEGYAILTSSSGNEAAQESDRIGGSFFTHALNTGLRGAADASRDGKVTLHEAYQFAFNETLARTQSTRGGPQHAGYEIQLTGSGDVVLTDIREASATMQLSKELYGRLFIRDSLDHLAAELNKPAGADMQIGLAPGTYGLRLLRGDVWSEASVTLVEGKAVSIVPGLFRQLGSPPPTATDSTDIITTTVKFHHVPPTDPAGFSTALFYDVQNREWHGTQLAPLATDARSHLRGGQLALGFNVTRGDLEGNQLAVAVNAVGGSMHGFQIAQTNVVSGYISGAQVGGVFGIVGEHVTGLQLSGIFSVAGENLKGWQASGIFNVAGGATKGGQIAGIFNVAGDSVHGAQAAGIFNVAGDSVRGSQAAGIFNVAGRGVTGGQAAGIFNVAGKTTTGGQAAGIFNVAGDTLCGAQFAGIFNHASHMKGLQLGGILNIAGTANGYQIGLINLSDHYQSGAPIGLINISRKGTIEAESWVEETGFVFTGLRTGAGWMRSQFAVGVKPRGQERLLAPTMGLAGEFDFTGTPLYLETGILYSALFSVDKYPVEGVAVESDWGRVRLGLGIRPLSFLSVVGGVSYNAMIHPFADEPLTGTDLHGFRTYRDVVSTWPGAWVGVRIGK